MGESYLCKIYALIAVVGNLPLLFYFAWKEVSRMTWTDYDEYNSEVRFKIGQRIQKLRIDKKIAAVDLAIMLKISSNQMSRIENGRANCTIPQLYVISQILGCSVDYLLFGKKSLTISVEQEASIKGLIDAFSK